MKTPKIILILWAIVLIALICTFLTGCTTFAEMNVPKEMPTDSYRYDFKIIDNKLKLPDEQFIDEVMESIKGTDYVLIKFVEENRMGKKYIAYAYVFYPKGTLKK